MLVAAFVRTRLIVLAWRQQAAWLTRHSTGNGRGGSYPARPPLELAAFSRTPPRGLNGDGSVVWVQKKATNCQIKVSRLWPSGLSQMRMRRLCAARPAGRSISGEPNPGHSAWDGALLHCLVPRNGGRRTSRGISNSQLQIFNFQLPVTSLGLARQGVQVEAFSPKRTRRACLILPRTAA